MPTKYTNTVILLYNNYGFIYSVILAFSFYECYFVGYRPIMLFIGDHIVKSTQDVLECCEVG